MWLKIEYQDLGRSCALILNTRKNNLPNNGLGNLRDQGDGVLKFGSRFNPEVASVKYEVLGSLLDDIVGDWGVCWVFEHDVLLDLLFKEAIKYYSGFWSITWKLEIQLRRKQQHLPLVKRLNKLLRCLERWKELHLLQCINNLRDIAHFIRFGIELGSELLEFPGDWLQLTNVIF